MAPSRDAVEFNKIIQADREKKKKQDLADRIFSRRSSAPAAGVLGSRKGPAGPSSLSSRITKPGKPIRLTKPSASAAPFTRVQNQNVPLHRSASTSQLHTNRRNQAIDAVVNNRPAPQPNPHQPNQVLNSAPNGRAKTQNSRDQAGIRGSIANSGVGISVRGIASQPQEYAIVAQNFAPGTTAEDIESVFAPDPAAVGLLSCKLLLEMPTVIAQLIYDNRKSAEEVVIMFNNKVADDRVLHVYDNTAAYHRGATTRTAKQPSVRQLQLLPNNSEDAMNIDSEEKAPRHDPTGPRQTRAQPEVQDGRYGFPENIPYPSREYNRGGTRGGGLVSDRLISVQPRNGGNYRGDRFRR